MTRDTYCIEDALTWVHEGMALDPEISAVVVTAVSTSSGGQGPRIRITSTDDGAGDTRVRRALRDAVRACEAEGVPPLVDLRLCAGKRRGGRTTMDLSDELEDAPIDVSFSAAPQIRELADGEATKGTGPPQAILTEGGQIMVPLDALLGLADHHYRQQMAEYHADRQMLRRERAGIVQVIRSLSSALEAKPIAAEEVYRHLGEVLERERDASREAREAHRAYMASTPPPSALGTAFGMLGAAFTGPLGKELSGLITEEHIEQLIAAIKGQATKEEDAPPV